jgi:hypothetical protein
MYDKNLEFLYLLEIVVGDVEEKDANDDPGNTGEQKFTVKVYSLEVVKHMPDATPNEYKTDDYREGLHEVSETFMWMRCHVLILPRPKFIAFHTPY